MLLEGEIDIWFHYVRGLFVPKISRVLSDLIMGPQIGNILILIRLPFLKEKTSIEGLSDNTNPVL